MLDCACVVPWHWGKKARDINGDDDDEEEAIQRRISSAKPADDVVRLLDIQVPPTELPTWLIEINRAGKGYGCVSYVAGKHSEYTVTVVNPYNSTTRLATCSSLPQSSFDAVVDAGTSLGLRYLWYDDACIDHKNLVEKSRVVLKMGTLFANARITLVVPSNPRSWLSDPKFIEPPSGPRQGSRWSFKFQEKSEEAEEDPWLTRVWTFYEGAASGNVVVLTKTGLVTLTHAREVTYGYLPDTDSALLDEKKAGKGQKDRAKDKDKIMRNVSLRSAAVALTGSERVRSLIFPRTQSVSRLFTSRGYATVLEALVDCGDRGVSLQLDRLFAMICCLRYRASLQVSYDWSLQEATVRTLKGALIHGKDVSVLFMTRPRAKGMASPMRSFTKSPTSPKGAGTGTNQGQAKAKKPGQGQGQDDTEPLEYPPWLMDTYDDTAMDWLLNTFSPRMRLYEQLEGVLGTVDPNTGMLVLELRGHLQLWLRRPNIKRERRGGAIVTTAVATPGDEVGAQVDPAAVFGPGAPTNVNAAIRPKGFEGVVLAANVLERTSPYHMRVELVGSLPVVSRMEKMWYHADQVLHLTIQGRL